MTGTDYRQPVEPLRPGDALDAASFAVITDMPVKSAITRPAAGFRGARDEALTVEGWAWSRATPVAAVRVSADGGATWAPTGLAEARDAFAWRRFSVSVRPPLGPVLLMAQARDVAGNVQPIDDAPGIRGAIATISFTASRGKWCERRDSSSGDGCPLGRPVLAPSPSRHRKVTVVGFRQPDDEPEQGIGRSTLRKLASRRRCGRSDDNSHRDRCSTRLPDGSDSFQRLMSHVFHQIHSTAPAQFTATNRISYWGSL